MTAKLFARARALALSALCPPAGWTLRIVLFAAALFVVYFQFFFGPVWATLLVLAAAGYAAAVVCLLVSRVIGGEADLPGHGRIVRLLRRADLRCALGFTTRAAVNLLYTLFCLLAGAVGHMRAFAAPAAYSAALFLVSAAVAHLQRRGFRAASGSPVLGRLGCRIVSLLLVPLAASFAAVTAGTILDGRAARWPAFVLAFQILFTAARLALCGADAFRARGESAALPHLIRDVNLTAALVALYTTAAELLGRFIPDEGLYLALTVTAGALILTAVSAVAVRSVRRAFRPDAA